MLDSNNDQPPAEESAAADERFDEIIKLGKRYARRFLAGLSEADRKDVFQDAVIKLLEKCDELPANAEGFFVNACRDAVKKLRREARRLSSAELRLDRLDVGAIVLPDPLTEAIGAEHLDKFLSALPAEDRKIAELKSQGLTREEIMKTGVSKRAVDRASARIRKLSQFRPDDEIGDLTDPSGRTPPCDPSDDRDYTLSGIDLAISELDCPPSWRALLPQPMWSEPAPVDKSKDPEVAAAVAAIESRKKELK